MPLVIPIWGFMPFLVQPPEEEDLLEIELKNRLRFPLPQENFASYQPLLFQKERQFVRKSPNIS